jgi:type I restriction enzyme, R subunit
VTDETIRQIIASKTFSRLATNPKLTLEQYKALNGWRNSVPEYVRDHVVLDMFK